MQGFVSGGVKAELPSPPVSPTLPHPVAVQMSEGGGVCGADGELERRRDLQEGTRIWLSGWSWRPARGGALPEPRFPQRAASQGWAPHRGLVRVGAGVLRVLALLEAVGLPVWPRRTGRAAPRVLLPCSLCRTHGSAAPGAPASRSSSEQRSEQRPRYRSVAGYL